MSNIRSLVLCALCLILLCSAASYAEEKSQGINLQDMTIEELLALQDEIQLVLVDKGYGLNAESGSELVIPVTNEPDTLELGITGSERVRALQTYLMELGWYDGEADGNFGPDLEKAVKAFQKWAKKKATGIIEWEWFNQNYWHDSPF